MKKLVILLLLINIHLNAQVGIGTVTPDISSVLDITSTTKGLLPPRMTTAQRDAITAPAEGLFVYNLDTTCFQYFNGSVWSACLGTTSAIKSLVCPPSPIVNGYYVAGTPNNTTNTIIVSITTTAADSYSITTNTVNGYSFTASGVLLTAGTHSITLSSTGTPISVGTDNFTISLAGSVGTCTLNIPVAATAPPILKNCQELMVAGFTTNGVYSIDSDGAGGNAPYNCYCNQTDNGGGWTLIFNHDVIGGYWASDAQADFFNVSFPGITTNKYSILQKIDELQTTAGTYEFRLHYPDQAITNHWSQTFNPRSGGSTTNPVAGYTAITIAANGSGWGGLERSGTSTYLDGVPSTGTWWYSLGSINSYAAGGMPGPNNIVVQRVQLYIR